MAVRLPWIVFLVACSHAGSDPTIPAIDLDPKPLLASEIKLEEPISPEPDGGGFARAMDLGFAGDKLLVLENANSRIVVFDSTFHPIRFIGRPGAGPGELRGVYALAVWNGQYAVTEIGNGRVSEFGADGRFHRSVLLPNGFTQLAYGPDGTLYVSAYDQRNYLLAIDREGIARPFAERPWDLYPEEVLAASRLREESVDLAVTDGGLVHVYDPYLGALVEFGPDGQRLATRRLPASVLDGLSKTQALTERDFGGSGRHALPTITSFTATDDDRLLLLFPAIDGLFGLMVDASTYHAWALRWGPGADPRLAGFGGVVHRGRFYRLGFDELRVFQLESPAPRRR
jgi:hypothetical protein